MKKMLLLCSLLFTALATPVSTPALRAENPFLDGGGQNSIDTLHAAITKSPYTYIRGFYTLSIKFHGNGTGEQQDWKFKWHSKDAQTIEIEQLAADGKPNGKKCVFIFSNDYTSYTGTDPDGITKISGKQVTQ